MNVHEYHCIRDCIDDDHDTFPWEGIREFPFLWERTDGLLLWRFFTTGGPGCVSQDRPGILAVVGPFRKYATVEAEHTGHPIPPFLVMMSAGRLHCADDGHCINKMHEIAQIAGRNWYVKGVFCPTPEAMDDPGVQTFSLPETYWRDFPCALQELERRRYGPAHVVCQDTGESIKQEIDHMTFPEDVRTVMQHHLNQGVHHE